MLHVNPATSETITFFSKTSKNLALVSRMCIKVFNNLAVLDTHKKSKDSVTLATFYFYGLYKNFGNLIKIVGFIGATKLALFGSAMIKMTVS